MSHWLTAPLPTPVCFCIQGTNLYTFVYTPGHPALQPLLRMRIRSESLVIKVVFVLPPRSDTIEIVIVSEFVHERSSAITQTRRGLLFAPVLSLCRLSEASRLLESVLGDFHRV